jgi:hypothetical protein
MASQWQGGDNYYLYRRGCSNARQGGSNDGQKRKKYGDAGTRKKARFNANPTYCNHPACIVMRQAKEDKAKYDFKDRPVKFFVSRVRNG